MESFSSRLEALLGASSATKTSIAEAAGLTRRALNYYLRGERDPTLSVLTALADYFDVSIDYLVGRSDDPARH